MTRARAGHAALSPRGFSMLEIVVALAVVALAAGLIAGSLGAWGRVARQRDTVDRIVRSLGIARLEAMKAQHSVTVAVAPAENGELSLETGAGVTTFRTSGLVPVIGVLETPADAPIRRSTLIAAPVDELAHTGRAAALKARFDSSGRADTRLWRFAQADESRAEGTPGRTLWLIRFDAVSGAVAAERAGPPAGAGRSQVEPSNAGAFQ